MPCILIALVVHELIVVYGVRPLPLDILHSRLGKFLILLVLFGKFKDDVHIHAASIGLVIVHIALVQLVEMCYQFLYSPVRYILARVRSILIQDMEYHRYMIDIVIACYRIAITVLRRMCIKLLFTAFATGAKVSQTSEHNSHNTYMMFHKQTRYLIIMMQRYKNICRKRT